jgi:MFS family permease
VLIAAAAALISLGVVQSDSWGGSDPRTISAVTAGVVVLVIFIFQQRRTRAPVLDLELFKIRNFAWGNSATLTFSMAFTAMFFSSILFLTQVWDYSTITAGLAVAPGPLIVATLAPVMGTLAGRIGQRPMLITGGLLFATGGMWRLVMLGGEADYVVDYLPSMILTGLGVALCLPQLSSVVAQSLPPNRFGVGGGVNQALRQFAGTLGVALTIAFVASSTSLDSALTNFDKVWWLLIIGGVATSALSLALRTRRTATTAVAMAAPLAGEVA